jgi:hypothetical protein
MNWRWLSKTRQKIRPLWAPFRKYFENPPILLSAKIVRWSGFWLLGSTPLLIFLEPPPLGKIDYILELRFAHIQHFSQVIGRPIAISPKFKKQCPSPTELFLITVFLKFHQINLLHIDCSFSTRKKMGFHRMIYTFDSSGTQITVLRMINFLEEQSSLD